MTGNRKMIRKQALKRLVLTGVGNIGSSLIPHLARLSGVGQVTIIDRDIYEQKNLMVQAILPGDVGRAKAAVQARRLRRINPSLEVQALQVDLHDIPLGELRADVILACLDSREARRVINQTAWRLGVPWIDAGISADHGLFARVTVYIPASDTPCLECAWDERDYARLEHAQPCVPGVVHAAPTNAPASLGALAAALQAIECQKVLEGDWEHTLKTRQMIFDVQHHAYCLTNFRRNAHCRFDHGIWQIRVISRKPREITFGQIFDAENLAVGSKGWIRAEGRPFVRKLQCSQCGRTRKTLALRGRLSHRQTVCRGCRKRMEPIGFDMVDRLDLTSVAKQVLSCPLSFFGFRRGDVFSIGPVHGGEIHFEIGGNRQ